MDVEVENLEMTYELRFVEDMAHISTIGYAMPEGYTSLFFDLVTSSVWVPGMNILIDYNCLEVRHLLSVDLQEISTAIGRYREKLGQGKCAIATSNITGFGIGRMLQVQMDYDTDLQVRVFYSLNKAKQWLSKTRVSEIFAESFC